MQSLKKGFAYKAMAIVLTCGLSLSAIAADFATTEALAKKGDASAQYELARMYDDVRGVSKNDSTSVEWYIKAAEQGHVAAQAHLGYLYRFGIGSVNKNLFTAAQWYLKAANQGHVRAMSSLAHLYMKGEGVRQDFTKAIKLSSKAANQGDANAPYHLAQEFEMGKGVRQNLSEAKEWYGKSCDNGLNIGCDKYRELNEQGY